MTTESGGLAPPQFRVLTDTIETRGETAASFVEDNIRRNIERPVPRLHKSPGFGKFKNRKLAIVCGGPSLKATLEELRAFDGDVMACGTVHDFLHENHIQMDYAVVCDPSPITARWLTRIDPHCTYLLSSSADAKLYDFLSDASVLMWHCYGGDPTQFKGELAICGGCTVTLRAICLAIAMGYIGEHHFFGFDSSFESEDSHHAYSHDAETSTRTLVRVGGDDGRIFTTTNGWLAQASQFQEMLRTMGHMFHPIIHGDGLIAEIMKVAGRTYTRPDDQFDGQAFQQSLGKVPEHYKETVDGRHSDI